MWFIKSWIYKSRYGSLPFKMRNFTESYQEECREVIKDEFKTITAKLPHIWTRIRLKDAKGKMHDFDTDILGRKIPVKQRTESEVVSYKQHQISYLIVVLLLFVFETFLYSMVAYAMTPNKIRDAYPGIEYIIGAAFAVIFIILLHFGFKGLWRYLQAKYLVEKENLDKVLIKPFISELIFSLFLIILFVSFNIAGAIKRSEIIEGGKDVSAITLFFSVAATFAAALAMAWTEKEITEKSEWYGKYKNWKRQQRERKVYNTQVKDMLKKCLDRKSVLIEEYWGVMKDLQRVFEVEVDADREALYAELNTMIANNKIDLLNIDEVTYQKYLPVAITRHELFEYGITTDKGINETIDDLKKKVAEIEEFEKRNAANSISTDNSEKPNNTNT